MSRIKESRDLYPEQRKKLKYINNNFNYDSLETADKNNKLKMVKDTVVSTVGMYPVTKNNQDMNFPLESELRFGLHDPKRLQEMALDVGKYAPIEYNKLTDGGDIMLNGKYDKLSVLQDFDKSVKTAGQVFTFKSSVRKNNLDYSEYMTPPKKTFGRGVGIPEAINDVYLGDEARTNNFDVRSYEFTREQELPIDYYVVNGEDLPFPKQGVDTRYLNYKNARNKNL